MCTVVDSDSSVGTPHVGEGFISPVPEDDSSAFEGQAKVSTSKVPAPAAVPAFRQGWQYLGICQPNDAVVTSNPAEPLGIDFHKC